MPRHLARFDFNLGPLRVKSPRFRDQGVRPRFNVQEMEAAVAAGLAVTNRTGVRRIHSPISTTCAPGSGMRSSDIGLPRRTSMTPPCRSVSGEGRNCARWSDGRAPLSASRLTRSPRPTQRPHIRQG